VATKIAFQYTGKDANGRAVAGSIEAETENDAQNRLRQQQLREVKLAVTVAKRPGGLFEPPRKAGIGELSLFTRQLATMIGAGIPLLEAFEILADQTKTQNKGFGLGLQEVADLVRGGTELSEAMQRYKRIFPEIYVNMIKAGEASGQLDIILNRMADFLEANEALKREIKSAMTYPVISLCLIVGITFYLMVGVVPKFKDMFSRLGSGQLPTLTQYVSDASEWCVANWQTLLFSPVIFVVAWILIMRTYQGQRTRDLLFLRVPIFGPLLQKVALSRFARTFSTLLSSGVPLLQALEIVAKTSGNRIIEEVLLETRETVRRGETLSSYLGTCWVFPPMVTKMISIGERSGALEQLLSKISDFYDSQVHATVKSLTSLIEPIMLLIMGSVVGTIVIAIFMPILELQKQLQK
jgi:type IV pilus assembly protein PilC